MDEDVINIEDCMRLRGVAQINYRDPIETFLKRVMNQRGIQTLYIVSPWIGRICDQVIPNLANLIQHLEKQQATLIVITRPKDRENRQHSEALQLIKSSKHTILHTLKGLHAKIYLVTTKYGEFAMIGSPNLSEMASVNYEIGLIIESQLWGQNLIRELKNTIFQLRKRAIT